MTNLVVLLVLGVSLLAVGPVSAQNNPTVTVDESGNGTIVFTVPPGTFSTPGSSKPIRIRGLSSALTYDLLGPRASLRATSS